MGTIKAFKAFCDFEGKLPSQKEPLEKSDGEKRDELEGASAVSVKLGYTINLNLPATDDIKVFDAIFRSLKEHLLKG